MLPAVLGTAELLTSYPAVSDGYGISSDRYASTVRSKSAGRFSYCHVSDCWPLGVWPNYLFPLIWVGPLLLVVSLQELAGRPTVLSSLAQDDRRGVWISALAALICGFVWELWNWKSLAHWEYAIPFVHRFQLFEMPLLGYAGYLPFGLECVAVADLCLSRRAPAKWIIHRSDCRSYKCRSLWVAGWYGTFEERAVGSTVRAASAASSFRNARERHRGRAAVPHSNSAHIRRRVPRVE